MRLKISLLLILAVALAFVAGLTSFMYLGTVNRELASTRAALKSFDEIAYLPVVTREVRPGDVLTAADFGKHPAPVNWLPSDALQELPELPEGGEYIAFDDIRPGALLLQRMVGVKNLEGDFQPVQLGDGLSAGAFSISNIDEIKKWLTVGSKADLFVLTKQGNDPTVRLLAQGFEVLSLPEDKAVIAPTEVNSAVLGTTPLLQTASLTVQPSRAQQPKVVMLAGQAADVAKALAGGREGELHLVLSSGDRLIEQGQVLVGQGELAGLPVATRDFGERNGSAVITAPLTVASGPASMMAPLIPANSSRKTCSTALIRGGARVMVEVPC